MVLYNNLGYRTSIRTLALMLVAVLLAACSRSNNFQDLQVFVDEVKARPGAQIEPVPVFEAYEAFTYSAASLRSPFDIPIVIQQNASGAVVENVEPDLDRIREPLENFALSELMMVGMLERDGHYQALIRDTVGEINRVAVGDYLGRNHGKVLLITRTQIDLMEIVPSGGGGWVERPQSLTLVQ
ncbi:MAG: pilus assembly protein PilP [Pseudohongiellaceae bacterium]